MARRLVGLDIENPNYKHGCSKSKLYKVYYAMLERCYNKNYKRYSDYGARGITVSKDWLKSFVSFKSWAEENGYQEGLTLDRIDNNKGYSSDNCRWVTYKVQGNNSRKCHYLEYKGIRKTLKQWSEDLGINYSTLRNRINRSHMTLEEAFTKEIKNG